MAAAQAGDWAGAVRLFAKLQRGKKPDADSICNMAYCLRRLERNDEAEAALRRALKLQPDHAAALLNLASLLIGRDDLVEAEEVMRRGVALYPNDVGMKVNLASAVFHQARYDDAAVVAEAALVLQPDNPHAHHTLANILLVKGDYAEGFRHYQWRLQCGEAALALDGDAMGIPLWQGESLDGKTLLVVTEQGLGDTLHFIRYGALVRAGGGRMLLTCPAAMRRLFSAAPCIDAMLHDGDPRPVADYHVPLLSLPHRFGTTRATVPAAVPYLRAADEWVAEWAPRLGQRRRPRIGLVWAGSPTHKNDRNRSIPLSLFAPLLDGADWECFALQFGMRDEDRATLDRFPGVGRQGEGIRDFADTAALLSQMDLLITVDTSVAHLAGALGIPVWVMLPSVPDWRWMLDREDSPWYPTLRLFRQPVFGDWASVMDRVLAALRDFVALRPQGGQPAEWVVPVFNRAVAAQQAGRVDEARDGYRQTPIPRPCTIWGCCSSNRATWTKLNCTCGEP
jgi:Tetratricopeptide repeat